MDFMNNQAMLVQIPKNTWARCEICSQLVIKIPGQC